MTKVAVVGVGHLGKQHARLYAELAELVGVVDIQKTRAEEIAALYKTRPFTDYRELFGQVDAVSLAVPTVDHARIGVDLLEHGIDVLVEKPIASSVEQAQALVQRARGEPSRPKARKLAEQALKLDPNWVDAMMIRAQTRPLSPEERGRAEELLRVAAEKEPA